jgi:GNAT superfamily N-acetyltransferase
VEAIKNDMHFNPDPVIDGETEMYFFLNGMYTLPSARGQGLGPALVEYSKNVASELASKRKGRLVLVVDYENEFARRTYEKCGFAIIQRYWFDDYREGRSERTEAAVMKFDIGN